MKFQSEKEYNEIIKILDFQLLEMNDKKITALNRLKELAEKNNDSYIYAAYYFYHALSYPIDERIEITEKSLRLAETSGNVYIQVKSYNCLGIDYSEKADYIKSLQNYLKAYYLSTKHEEYDLDWVVLNNIGNLFVWIEDYENGVSFIESAYNKYMSKKEKEPLMVMQLMINLIELHSFAHHFDKVDYWTSLDDNFFEYEGKEIVECMIQMNTIVKKQDVFTADELVNEIERFTNKCESIDDFIYIFRMAIKILEIAVEKADEKACRHLIKMMHEKRNKSEIAAFDLDFDSVLCLFDFKYENKTFDENFLNYYRNSKSAFKMLRNTYSKSLLVQIELEEEKETHKDTAEEKILLQKKLEIDPFTEIYNKIYVENKISEDLLKNSKAGHQVLFVIDIDYFKRVNDELGHDVGDSILLGVADVLRKYKQENYIVGRYGGDEFILYIKNAESNGMVKEIANKLLKETKAIKTAIADMPHITFSIGIAVNNGEQKFDPLFKRADEALYQSKKNGRNQFTIV